MSKKVSSKQQFQIEAFNTLLTTNKDIIQRDGQKLLLLEQIEKYSGETLYKIKTLSKEKMTNIEKHIDHQLCKTIFGKKLSVKELLTRFGFSPKLGKRCRKQYIVKLPTCKKLQNAKIRQTFIKKHGDESIIKLNSIEVRKWCNIKLKSLKSENKCKQVDITNYELKLSHIYDTLKVQDWREIDIDFDKYSFID